MRVFINKKQKKTLNKAEEKLVYAAAIINPLLLLPQIVKMYQVKDSSSWSLLSWSMYMVVGLVFLIYAIHHRLKPLILTQVLWYIVDALVIYGILKY
jgi:uncharacterized protein with PQ loop repeat